MTPHFSDDERVAAADGSLDPTRLTHMEACAECRQVVGDLRALLQQIARVDVPEPSPLFWDHFSRRVSAATAGRNAAVSTGTWRAWLSLAATAATVFAAVWLVRQPALGPGAIADDAYVEADRLSAADSVEWGSVVAATGTTADEDVFAVADDAVLSVEDLTSDERVAFVRLLSQQLDVLQ